MSKLYDFLEKAAGDDASSARINSILGGSKFEDATDEQLGEICEVAKKLGFDIAPDDIKEGEVRELSEDELDDVAGGYVLILPVKRPSPGPERVYPTANNENSRTAQVKCVDIGGRNMIIFVG